MQSFETSLEFETDILRDRDETWDIRDRDAKKTGLETSVFFLSFWKGVMVEL